MQTDITQTMKQPSAGRFRYKSVFAWGYTYVKCYYKAEWDFNTPRCSKANINSLWKFSRYKPVTEEIELVQWLIVCAFQYTPINLLSISIDHISFALIKTDVVSNV